VRAGGRALECPQDCPVSDSGLDEWLALQHVHDGGVAKSAGAYFDHGRPAPEHLTGVFDRLIWTGLVSVAAGDPIWELRRLSLTDAGAVRYAALGEQRRDTPQPPPPEHATTQPPAGRRSNAELPAASSGRPGPTRTPSGAGGPPW
jgi:hypothetical protein